MTGKMKAKCRIDLPSRLPIYNPPGPRELTHYAVVNYKPEEEEPQTRAMETALWRALRREDQGTIQRDKLLEFGVGKYVTILEVYDPVEKRKQSREARRRKRAIAKEAIPEQDTPKSHQMQLFYAG